MARPKKYNLRRCVFYLDVDTAQIIEKLANKLNISQSELVNCVLHDDVHLLSWCDEDVFRANYPTRPLMGERSLYNR